MTNPITQLAAVRRRLAKLEPDRPYFDVAPFLIPLVTAMVKGRPFSRLPSKRELSPEEELGIERVLRDLDRVANPRARLHRRFPGRSRVQAHGEPAGY